MVEVTLDCAIQIAIWWFEKNNELLIITRTRHSKVCSPDCRMGKLNQEDSSASQEGRSVSNGIGGYAGLSYACNAVVRSERIMNIGVRAARFGTRWGPINACDRVHIFPQGAICRQLGEAAIIAL